MEFIYRPSEYELSLTVLFVANNLKTSATARILNEVISNTVQTSYFEIGNITFKLMKNGYIESLEIEGENVFSITESGKNAIEFFYNSIPFSVREKLLAKIDEANQRAKVESNVVARCATANGFDYITECEITEAGETLLKISLNTGSAKAAEAAAVRFKAKHKEIYDLIINALC